MFARVLFGAVFSVLVVVSSLAHAIIIHDAAKDDPVWGQEHIDVAKKYDCVVAVFGRNQQGWGLIGTGTVISPYDVLFARHCAFSNDGSPFLEYRINTGTHLIEDRWARYETFKMHEMPGYTGVGSPDMAILTFDQVIRDVTPATLYRGNDLDLIGSVVDMIGFGYLGYPSVGPVTLDGAKRGCQNIIEQLGYPPSGYGTHQLITYFHPPGHPNYQHLGGGGLNFDSGGGWFVNGQLVAVADWTAAYAGYNDPTGATSVSQHIGWIDSIIVPEPGTLIMFGTGVVFVLFFLRRKRR